MTGVTPTDSNSSASRQPIEDFSAKARETILNLGKSDTQVYDYVAKVLSSDSSIAERTLVQQLVEARGRAETALSQIIRAMGDAARSVINNIR